MGSVGEFGSDNERSNMGAPRLGELTFLDLFLLCEAFLNGHTLNLLTLLPISPGGSGFTGADGKRGSEDRGTVADEARLPWLVLEISFILRAD